MSQQALGMTRIERCRVDAASALASRDSRRVGETLRGLGAVGPDWAAGRDLQATAAEVVTIAWRRLPTVPDGDPRPWLIAAARNVLMNQWRRETRERSAITQLDDGDGAPAPTLGLA